MTDQNQPNSALAAALAAVLLAAAVGGCDGFHAAEPIDTTQALAENRWNDAARGLAAQIEQDPANAGLTRQRVKALLALGDGEGAAAAIRKLGQANPEALKDSSWQVLTAEADIWRGQSRQALQSLAFMAGPDAARLRAIALGIEGKYDEAHAQLVEALEQSPGDARLNADLAIRLIADQDYQAALIHVDRAMQAAPQSLDARFAKAALAEATGKVADART